MIKGCNKRVIVMRDTGNAMIEEAIFIIKPCSDKGFVSEEDIIKHANSILDKSASAGGPAKLFADDRARKKGPFMTFCFGAVMGAAFAIGILLIL